jgi:hypothetical protein
VRTRWRSDRGLGLRRRLGIDFVGRSPAHVRPPSFLSTEILRTPHLVLPGHDVDAPRFCRLHRDARRPRQRRPGGGASLGTAGVDRGTAGCAAARVGHSLQAEPAKGFSVPSDAATFPMAQARAAADGSGRCRSPSTCLSHRRMRFELVNRVPMGATGIGAHQAKTRTSRRELLGAGRSDCCGY